MARAARRKPYNPSKDTGDHGTGTAAQTANTYLQPVPEDKNGQRRRVRQGALELLQKQISPRQYDAGKAIRDAFEATQTSPPAIKEIQVDTCPSPDATIDVQVDKQSDYAAVMRAVPSDMKAVVFHVCCDNLPISHRAQGRMVESEIACLQVALDLAANDMRL